MAGARGEIILSSLPSLCTFPPPCRSRDRFIGRLGSGFPYAWQAAEKGSLGSILGSLPYRSHLGFPEFTRFSLAGFPTRLLQFTAERSTD